MENLSGYCKVVAVMDKDNVHVHYHDKEYGFPIDDDNHLFARLVLEINQAGLSWTTILNKKDNFFKAYDDFDIGKVAKYGARAGRITLVRQGHPAGSCGLLGGGALALIGTDDPVEHPIGNFVQIGFRAAKLRDAGKG